LRQKGKPPKTELGTVGVQKMADVGTPNHPSNMDEGKAASTLLTYRAFSISFKFAVDVGSCRHQLQTPYLL
jgi:hypothetical protein